VGYHIHPTERDEECVDSSQSSRADLCRSIFLRQKQKNDDNAKRNKVTKVNTGTTTTPNPCYHFPINLLKEYLSVSLKAREINHDQGSYYYK
jgi:hypothetical protein